MLIIYTNDLRSILHLGGESIVDSELLPPNTVSMISAKAHCVVCPYGLMYSVHSLSSHSKQSKLNVLRQTSKL